MNIDLPTRVNIVMLWVVQIHVALSHLENRNIKCGDRYDSLPYLMLIMIASIHTSEQETANKYLQKLIMPHKRLEFRLPHRR